MVSTWMNVRSFRTSSGSSDRSLALALGTSTVLIPARRAGMKTVLVPKSNAKDLAELPEEVRNDLTFIQVETMDEVLEHALDRTTPKLPDPRPDDPAAYAH